MASAFTMYMAGIGTVVVAVAGGFGGGLLIADRFSGTGAVPEPGKSRIEQVRSNPQSTKIVERQSAAETTGTASTEESPPNLSTSKELRSLEGSMPVVPPTVRRPEPTISPVNRNSPAPTIQTEPSKAKPVLTGTKLPDIAKPAPTIDRLQVQPTKRSILSQRAPTEIRPKEIRKEGIAKAQVRPVNEDGFRYSVNTVNGRRATITEIAELTAKLRTGRDPDRRATFSYQPEGRQVLFGLFGH